MRENENMERDYQPIKDLRDYERGPWDAYFATMCGMAMHPQNINSGHSLPITRCAELADRMIYERRKRA